MLELSKKNGATWVVTNHQIAYFRPADLGENIIIQTQLIYVDATSIGIEATMYNEGRTHLKSLLWSTLRYVGAVNGRTTEHPEEVLNMLAAVQVTEVEHQPEGFQNRIIEINHSLKQALFSS